MESLGAALQKWAEREPTVSGLALIGSRVREASDQVWRADDQSDWDYHVISSRPAMFSAADWTRALEGVTVRAYAPRATRVGRVPKVSMILDGGEVDLVILHAGGLRLMKIAAAMGLHRGGRTKRILQDLAIVVRPGFRFVKGAETWDAFYRKVVDEVPDPRIDDAMARELAATFWCDSVWALRKVERGELVAAQRALHQSLAETNFRLLHELRLRSGGRSFPEARRIERVATPEELSSVTVGSLPNPESLRAAIHKAGVTCDTLMRGLVGEDWKRPV